MANEVTSSINFKYLSKEAESFLDNAGDNFLHSVYNLSEDVDINDRSWYDENVGSKWMRFEELSSDLILTVTAWGPPEAFYNGLYEKLQSLDSPDLEMWVRYDDEMPNFVGVWGRIGDWDYEEYVEEDYYERIIGCHPAILDEDGEWGEPNDDWYEELDKFFDSEYDCFLQCHKEYLEELEED